MKYLDERVVFEFTTTIEENGIYKYEVYKNGTIIFIGNTFLQPTTYVRLDITDIVKNYVSTLKPSFTTSGANKSEIVDQFTLALYDKEGELLNAVGDYVFLTYRAPFYNSEVTTEILDFNNTNPVHQPLLQGLHYSDGQALLLPTYPSVNSTIMTLDYVGLYPKLPFINGFSTFYKSYGEDNNGGLSRTINSSTGGAYEYSIPMKDFFKLTGVMTFDDMSELFDFTGVPTYFREEGISDGTTVYREYYNTRYEDGNPSLYLTSQNSIVYYTNGTFEMKTFNIVPDTDGAADYEIQYEFSDMRAISRIEVNLEYDDGGTDTINIVPNENNWELINAVDSSKDKLYIRLLVKPEGAMSIVEGIIFSTDVLRLNANLCDAEYIQLIAFSPIQSSYRKSYKIANIDGKSRYFLKWKDRYGMPQCQPFTGTEKYSEGINRSEIIKYTNQRRIVGINVQPKWVLNSNWIEERYFPIYESIFVSPYLMLYDAKEDKIYDVILNTNEYEEKTARNQNKQLFNLQLEVELDTKQTMIY